MVSFGSEIFITVLQVFLEGWVFLLLMFSATVNRAVIKRPACEPGVNGLDCHVRTSATAGMGRTCNWKFFMASNRTAL